MATVYKKVSKSEFDEQIKYCLSRYTVCVNAKYQDNKKFTGACRNHWWLCHKISVSYLSYFKNGKTYAFKCNRSDLNNEIIEPSTDNIWASRTLRSIIPDVFDKKCFGAHKVWVDGKEKVRWSISTIAAPYKVPDNGRWEHCYCYDVNSAYLASYLKPMPVMDSLKMYSITGPNQVGFDTSGVPHIADGKEHMYVFDLAVNEKLARYAKDKFTEYTEAKIRLQNDNSREAQQEKVDIKFQYTAGNGCIERFNIFYYNMIIHYSKTFMEQYIDDNTLYVSTDSIVSTTKRDLPIGNGLGQFKVEHADETYISENNGYGFEGCKLKQKGAHKCTIGCGFVLDWDNEKHIDEKLTKIYLKGVAND